MFWTVLEHIVLIGAALAAIVNWIGRPLGWFKQKQDDKLDTKLEETKNEMLGQVDAAFENTINEIVMPRFDSIDQKLTEHEIKLDKLTNSMVDVLRHEILETYEKYQEEKAIPLRKYEDIMRMYTEYTEEGGNSFIPELIDEMKEWRKY